MTILEMNIYNTLLAVEAEKAERNIEPTHTLVIRDRLRERVTMAISMPVSEVELEASLQHLAKEGRINIGNTINDTYVAINYFNFYH